MFLSPPQSPSAPSSPRLGATRPAGYGHRRGGSEFVGGSIRDGEAITVTNISPTKPDSGMASPSLQPTRPRRGHAHRRSAAISSHDLSSIIVPPPKLAKESSAPPSPAPSERVSVHACSVDAQAIENGKAASVSGPDAVAQAPQNHVPPAPDSDQTPRTVARNRVGFSDTLEFIPRPLSVVSNETSSTVTARPGHSLSGSISSVISATNADREATPFSGSGSAQKFNDSRPSTAGAIMERTQSAQEQDPSLLSPRRRGSIPLLGSLPSGIPLSPATPSPTRLSKKWSLFSREPCVPASPTWAQDESPRSTHSRLSMAEGSPMERVVDVDLREFADSPNAPKPLAKKRSKKKKKVKTWAGSILSRKGKHRHGKQKRRAPTPPPPRPFIPAEDEDDDALHTSSEPEALNPQSSGNGDWETWTFPKPAQNQEEDMSYQMIDLDAALGPFNTPLPRNPEWEAAQKAGGLVKKQLHSAAGMSRFTGPGMHYYHRRAESAPELVPFEGGRFGFRRFGSSSSMADVFEEDEEEEEESCGSSISASTPAAGTSIAEKPSIEAQTGEQLGKGCPGVEEETAPLSAEAGQDGGSEVGTAATAAEPAAVQPTITNCDEAVLVEPAPPFATEFSGSSPGYANSGSATPSPRHVFRPKELAPVEVSPLHLPTASLGPVSPWSMTQSSAFPSPRSPMSYDAQCISTAPSSVTEDNFQSLLMGEPGPEVRISVDDIPSLTSSNSTMTRESLFAQHPQTRHPPLNEQPRPASFTSTAFGRRRSSLASLSRLINSSHGERSKLSIEVPMESEPEKKAKTSKTRRLSRMMQFWKSKEGSTA
ncbi:hypothetical protein C7999DRAFT_14011 [Corynascus novoguineensis]|uniref:Cell wall proline rich protein n=1 Tax=Corynascus novoguineensis TaxID=1126955 RepID=A0AAN7CTC3_9PEZI|nr:hypothetical protein C7999DRAFT_14011 [Corynascus novoguineensis]